MSLDGQDVKLGLIPQQVDGQVLVKVGWLNIPKGCSGSSVACRQEVGKGGWAESVGIKSGAKCMTQRGWTDFQVRNCDQIMRFGLLVA